MRRTIYVVFVSWIVIACNKHSVAVPDLSGKWQLSAIFLQPTGVGSWYTEDSIPPNFVQFNPDGTLKMSAYVSILFGSPTNYQVISDSQFMVHYPIPYEANNSFGANIFYYKLTDSSLLIYPPDMELAIEKFIRVPMTITDP
jgi:hypothetical protein